MQTNRPTDQQDNSNEEQIEMNTIMSCSKYGVELAYGLLTVCFFNHNERMAAKYEERPSQTNQYYQDYDFQYPPMNEKFGLQFTNEEHVTESTTSGDMPSVTEVLDLTCSYRLLHSAIMDTTIDPHTCGENREVDDSCNTEKSCHFV